MHVLGLDLSSNMLSVAMDRLQKDKDTRVRYSLANVMECEYAPETFDIVYSRDCLQHNDDMPSLMKKIYVSFKQWVKSLQVSFLRRNVKKNTSVMVPPRL